MKKRNPVWIACFALAAACGKHQPQNVTACVPFDTQECLGSGACQGGQMCNADGSGWTTCDCGQPISTVGPSAKSGCESDAKASSIVCDDNGGIRSGTGKYWLNNNVWGRPANDPSSQQCSWLGCLQDDKLTWGTSWDWTGAGYTVKAYPSVVLGWQWGWVRGSGTGLPVTVAANHAINTNWEFAVTKTNDAAFELNVSYDLWLHTIANPDSSNAGENLPTDEVMLWLYKTESVSPLGSLVVTKISLGGATWNLWEGKAQGWKTYSFVRTENTNSVSLNLGAFLAYLATERDLASTKYLTSVEAGVEVFVGSGKVETSSYSCDVL